MHDKHIGLMVQVKYAYMQYVTYCIVNKGAVKKSHQQHPVSSSLAADAVDKECSALSNSTAVKQQSVQASAKQTQIVCSKVKVCISVVLKKLFKGQGMCMEEVMQQDLLVFWEFCFIG